MRYATNNVVYTFYSELCTTVRINVVALYIKITDLFLTIICTKFELNNAITVS